jgi:hypothetical protein
LERRLQQRYGELVGSRGPSSSVAAAAADPPSNGEARQEQ